jgi:hypothetical protein
MCGRHIFDTCTWRERGREEERERERERERKNDYHLEPES